MLLTQKNSLEHLRKKGVPHIVGSLASSLRSDTAVLFANPLTPETQGGLSYLPRTQRAASQTAELRLASEMYMATSPSQSSLAHDCNASYNAATVDLIGKSKPQNATGLLEPKRRTAVRFGEPETQLQHVQIAAGAKTLQANVSAGEKTSTISKNRTDEEKASLDWVEENCAALEKFAGEWLLVVGNELVAHSARHRDIVQIVKERRPVGALIHYVPRAEEAVFFL